MPATVKGTAHLYGISGTIANATVLSVNFKDAHKLEDATTDENGVEIERRYDDVQTEGTITIRIRSGYTVPTIGSNITYDAATYEITGIDRAQEAKGFRTVVINVKKSAGITYA